MRHPDLGDSRLAQSGQPCQQFLATHTVGHVWGADAPLAAWI